MKTVILVSTLSFAVIFGGLFFYARQQAALNSTDMPGARLTAEDVDAAERSFAALEQERESIQRERDALAAARAELAAQQQGLQSMHDEIEASIARLVGEQEKYGTARSDSADKLAKMFDAMKPDASAPIFRGLDRDISLEILTRMKEKSAAKLLAALDPGVAADLSTRLSLRGMP